jgi:hypothetical protein
MAGHSRSKDGVGEPVIGPRDFARARWLAYVPAIRDFLFGHKTGMPATSAARHRVSYHAGFGGSSTTRATSDSMLSLGFSVASAADRERAQESHARHRRQSRRRNAAVTRRARLQRRRGSGPARLDDRIGAGGAQSFDDVAGRLVGNDGEGTLQRHDDPDRTWAGTITLTDIGVNSAKVLLTGR